VGGATNSALLWRNIKSAAIVTCRVLAWIPMPTLALTQVNNMTKTVTMKMKVAKSVMEAIKKS